MTMEVENLSERSESRERFEISYSHKVKIMKSRNIAQTERVGRQSHALWRYVDDLYGPLDRDVDVTAVKDLVDKTPTASSIAIQPCT